MTMEQVSAKIQKLLALAGNNPDATEAQAALLKAQELMARYNMEESQLHSGDEGFKYDLLSSKVSQHKFNNQLGTIIADSFACKCVILNKKVAFFGREDNAKAAVTAMDFAFTVMRRGGNKATRDNGLEPGHQGAAHYYNAYVIGFLAGLKSAMDAQTVALAIVVPQDVKDEFSSRYETRKTRTSYTKAAYSKTAYNAGYADGSTVMNRRSLGA